MVACDLEECGSDLNNLPSVFIKLVDVNEKIAIELKGAVHDDKHIKLFAFIVGVNLAR
jgi:hypothetical protein